MKSIKSEPVTAYHVYYEGYSGGRITIGYFREIEVARQSATEFMEDIFPGNFIKAENAIDEFVHIELDSTSGRNEYFYCTVEAIELK